jgi:hypothetical protein
MPAAVSSAPPSRRVGYVELLLQWSEEQYDYIHPDTVINYVPSLP